jgi:phosphatidylglycerol:prolipoprotein diacylglycerol transferase
MAFYGAVFLGGVTLLVTCRRLGVQPGRALDTAAMFIPIAQACGRVGNIINGDIIGYRSNLPWATAYTNPANSFVPQLGVPYQPAAAYELLFSLALFGLLWTLRRRFTVPGTLFVVWLVLYSVGQFVLFFGRANVVVALGLKQAQLTAIAVVLLAIPLYLLWRRYFLARLAADDSEPAHLRAPDEPQGGASTVGAPPAG